MHIFEKQPWTTTGGIPPYVDYARGFYSCECIGSIDAPQFVPSGGTVKGEVAVIGGLSFREVDI